MAIHPISMSSTGTATALTRGSAGARWFGAYLVVLGGSHFVAPARWDIMTRLVSVNEVRRWTYLFGAFEAVAGVLVLNRRSRRLGYAALVAQTIFLTRRRMATLRLRG